MRTIPLAIFATALLFTALISPAPVAAQSADELGAIAADLEAQVIEWRRDFHQHPELSNREFRTAGIVADHLESMGMEVTTGIVHTGVMGILRGGRPGPTIALRADMDGLPVPERNDLPFRSQAMGEYRGETVPVMHACGHDTHVAIMMGVAEAMAAMRDDLPGTVKFIFQPAEEGPPEGEEGGAELMMKEGVLTDPAVEAALALHIAAEVDVGKITYRPGPAMASVQDYRIVVKGRQSHGAAPWMSVDPVVTGSQIVMGLQTIVARNLNITELPAIVTVVPLETGAEDFAFFAEEVPSFYYFLGGKPLDVPASEAASHHTPDFFIDESGLALGVESMLAVALDYLNGANPITEQ